MPVKYPKRTLTKIANREKLVVSAALLFSRNGYPNTTLNQIAIDAGLHVQTLYKHFSGKEALAVAAAEIVGRDLRCKFDEGFSTQSTFKIWRQWIESSASYLTELGLGEYKKQSLHSSSSSLIDDNYLLAIYADYENVLTEYLSKDFQMNPATDRLPRLVACMLWAGNEAAMKRCAGLDTLCDVLDMGERVVFESVGAIDDIEGMFNHLIKYPRT
jgi:AcrR family transcriptional regulator